MVSLTKSLSQALMIVYNTPLEIISRGLILREALDIFPCNQLNLCYQDPVAEHAAYSVKHAKPSADPPVLLRLLISQYWQKS